MQKSIGRISGDQMTLKPNDIYFLEKTVWTHEDFDSMGWHDVTIHGITFCPEDYEFVLDVDYMFAWVDPEPPSPGYTFWMSPATLVFQNVNNFKARIEDPLGLTIMDVERKDPRPPKNVEHIPFKTEWTWKIDLLQGEIEFSAVGYRQYTRRKPVRHSTQRFSPEERGSVSFERPEGFL
jgi:hypothetical protein